MVNEDQPITIAELYPNLTESELEEAKANLGRYLQALIRMTERLRGEGRSINDLGDLTTPSKHPRIQGERSNP